jgi:hypothetical protein
VGGLDRVDGLPVVLASACDGPASKALLGGRCRVTGGDAVEAVLQRDGGCEAEVAVADNGNGSYTLSAALDAPGAWRLAVKVTVPPLCLVPWWPATDRWARRCPWLHAMAKKWRCVACSFCPAGVPCCQTDQCGVLLIPAARPKEPGAACGARTALRLVRRALLQINGSAADDASVEVAARFGPLRAADCEVVGAAVGALTCGVVRELLIQPTQWSAGAAVVAGIAIAAVCGALR